MPSSDPGELVADACVLINLFATGEATEIVEGLDLRLVTSADVHGEAGHIFGPQGDDEEAPLRVPVDLSALEARGRLVMAIPEGDLLVAHVEAGLSDNDASVLALARERTRPLATDDRKIRKLAEQLCPEVVFESTLGLVRGAAERLAWPPDKIGEVLKRLRDAARFVPPTWDPHFVWLQRLRTESTRA